MMFISARPALPLALVCAALTAVGSLSVERQEATPTPTPQADETQAVTNAEQTTGKPEYAERVDPLLAATFDQNHFEYTNPEFTDDGVPLFESDMVLSEEQRNSRQATSNLWTSPISYAIDSTSEGDRAAIEAGINHWRSLTCLQFNEVQSGSSQKHLSFFKGGGCWSYVGKTGSSGAQQISIGGGCTGLGTVAHEIGHAMGLFHQQSRSDRDTYVLINTENIQSGKAGNFNKHTSSNNHSVPYDLTSVMHYGGYYFSSNGLPTIQTRNILHENLIGSRAGLSHRDQHIANAMYSCASQCPSSAPTCQNGGFLNKDCTCTCPSHTSGSTCENVQGTYYSLSQCGNPDMRTEGTITSPNYPQNFPKNVMCMWIITAGANQRVRITINDMKMLYRSNGRCYWDYLTLRYNGDIYTEDTVACNEELTGQSFESTNNQLVVKFVSGNYGWHRGFTADVAFFADTTTTTTSTTTITTSTTTAAPGGNCRGARAH